MSKPGSVNNKRRSDWGFPIVAQSAQEVVLGFDGKHLDFKIGVTDHSAPVTVATVVKTDSFLGRAYLLAIMPLHQPIVRHLLEHACVGQSIRSTQN